ISTRDVGTLGKALIRCGPPLQAGLLNTWHDHEDVLAEIGLTEREPRAFQKADLQNVGIESLIGAALIAPLVQSHKTMGTLCFTRKDGNAFLESQRQLVGWASEFLAEKILRALSHAVTERQARQDGLTELAN